MIRSDELAVIRAQLREKGALTRGQILVSLGLGPGANASTAKEDKAVAKRIDYTMDYIVFIAEAKVDKHDKNRWIGLDYQGRPIVPPRKIKLTPSCTVGEVERDVTGELRLKRKEPAPEQKKKIPPRRGPVSTTAYSEERVEIICSALRAGMTTAQAAEKAGATEWQVRHWLKAYPSFRARANEAGVKPGKRAAPPTRQELDTVRSMVAEGKTAYRIGRAINRDRKTVAKWIAEHGVAA